MELKTITAQSLQGPVIPNPQAFLYLAGTSTLATGLQDKDGNALTNPWLGSPVGRVEVAAPDGDYDLRVVGAGRDSTMRLRFIDSDTGSVHILREDLASHDDGKGGEIVAIDDAEAGARYKNAQQAIDHFARLQYADAGFRSTGGDDSAALQAFIDANKGKRLVVRDVCTFGAVSMVGASYNKTSIYFEQAKLKASPAAGANNWQAVWAGFAIQQVDGAEVNGRFHGSRTEQPQYEQIMCLVLAGVTNFRSSYLQFDEVRGDGLYISQANLTSNSANTNGVYLGRVLGFNSAPDGRNLVSHIGGNQIVVDDFVSINIGATINGVRMPGGWDTEPNFDYQVCNGLQIGKAYILHQGTSGFAVQSPAGSRCVKNVTVGELVSINDCPADLVDQAGNTTVTNNHLCTVMSVDQCTIGRLDGRFVNAYGDAVILCDSDGVFLNGRVSKVREGIRIADDARDVAGTGVRGGRVFLDVENTVRYGMRTGKISGLEIGGTVSKPIPGSYIGGLFGVYSRGYTQTDCEYKVSVKHSADWTRSYRNDNGAPANFVNTVIRDCDLSGSTWAGFTNQVGDMQVIRFDVRGVTDKNAVPAVGTNLWVAGQKFDNSSGTVGQPRGWTFSGSAMVSWGNL